MEFVPGRAGNPRPEARLGDYPFPAPSRIASMNPSTVDSPKLAFYRAACAATAFGRADEDNSEDDLGSQGRASEPDAVSVRAGPAHGGDLLQKLP